MCRCDGCGQEIGPKEYRVEVQATFNYCMACVTVTTQEELERNAQLLLEFVS